jgi:selenocysteine lyase/cysteine desulfurase
MFKGLLFFELKVGMTSLEDTISELSNSSINIVSKLYSGLSLPLKNYDWNATNRPLKGVETELQNNFWNSYGNPHSCGGITGELSRDVVEEARKSIRRQIKVVDDFEVLFGGQGSSYWFREICKTLVEDGVTTCITFQEELHNSLVQPWSERDDVCMYRGKSFSWIHKYIQLHPEKKIVLLITLSSHLTGKCIQFDRFEEFWSGIDERYRPRVVVDATCYLAHWKEIPKNLPYDFLAFSGHKFPGGPGSSGCLVIHSKYSSLMKENGTPDVLGICRLSLSTRLRSNLIRSSESKRNIQELVDDLRSYFIETERAATKFLVHDWENNSYPYSYSEPVISFSVYLKDINKVVHPQIVSFLLLNLFGIQIRAGNMCSDYTVAKSGLWTDLSGIDLKTTPVLQPGICRLSIPRYMITEEHVQYLKETFTEFLYYCRNLIPLFVCSWEGWSLHENFPILLGIKHTGVVSETGKTSCGGCQNKRESLLYSHKKSENSKKTSAIYSELVTNIVPKLKHEKDSIYHHPFRWFVHPLDLQDEL